MGKAKNKPKRTKESRLIQLPIEVLEKIGEKLNGEAVLNLRLTCSTLKSLVDNYLGIKTTMVEQPGYPKRKLDFIRRVCVHDVVFKNMIGQLEASNGLRTYFKYKYYFDDIFRYPHFLTHIGLDGKTDVQFIFDVLTKCINLKLFYLTGHFEFHGDFVPFLTNEKSKIDLNINPNERSSWLSMLSRRDDGFRQIKFRKLEWIHIDLGNKISNNDLLNVMLLLKCIRSDEMHRVLVYIGEIKDLTEMEYFHFSCIIADFLKTHIETLRDFSLRMEPPIAGVKLNEENVNLANIFTKHVQLEPNEIQGDGDENSVDQKINMILLLRQKLEAVGDMSKLTYLYIQIPPDFHWYYWLIFIEKQKNLNCLWMKVSTKYEILKNCDIIKNSKKSLKRLRLELDIINNFDFSGIEECEKLEEIYIMNQPIAPEIILHGPLEAHLKNVHLIPAGIKGLCLGNVVVATEDLSKMLSVQKHLDTLVIMNMLSMNPENGIDPKCLKKIFRMRLLHSCLIQTVRCKTQNSFHRVNQMLDFLMTPKEKELIHKFRTMDSRIAPLSVAQTAHCLDISSTETDCRYSWTKTATPDGAMFYSSRLSELDLYQ